MRPTLDFLLFDWLNVASLVTRDRYQDHSRETFEAVIDSAERVARERFAPFNRLVDTEEPRLDGNHVRLPAATLAATRAYAETGLLAAGQDQSDGGMQLPYVVDMAANCYFSMASISLSAYAMLTYANCNLLLAHGTPSQKRAFALPEMEGRFFGTMCLSEPQAGSSLGDIATRAVPDGDDFMLDPLGPRYRLKGNKMWISGGEHELSDNIVHLVLARAADYNKTTVPGVAGLSLFVVPRKMVDEQGQLTGETNDVSLAGLNHKLGYRGTVNTLLNFGEGKFPLRSPNGIDGNGAGAIGYLVGSLGDGLRVMFHMMNEARLNVGMGAAMLGFAGYQASLEYARNRTQGRTLGPPGKNANTPPVPIVVHDDVKRMLLAQKSYCEGALALCLYGARLVDEKKTGSREQAEQASALLELLTPVAKSWPSQWCLEANSLAIQVHGGYGYTRDFPVEQHWRDNRLNMIHEGTHGIQALDLLGRKILRNDGTGMRLWILRVEATMYDAATHPELLAHINSLGDAIASLQNAVRQLRAVENKQHALANSTDFMQAFGHIVVAWLWLDVACVVCRQLHGSTGTAKQRLQGLLQAAHFFFRFELPKVSAWLEVSADCDSTVHEMQDAWF